MSEQSRAGDRPVVALAGRRIDAVDTNPPRFPLEAVPTVRRRLADLLAKERAAALVCSAACGADLVALEEAERLGLKRRVVLPFPPERFRKTSVTDRPGDWASVFDRVIAAAESTGDLVVLPTFQAVTTKLMPERTTQSFARHRRSPGIAVRVD
jgi:hypothetical protein